MTSTFHWFETELLTREENLVGLITVNRDVIGQAETLDRADRVVLDMDSSESIDSWSLTSLQQRLVKTGGRLVKHARYYWLLLAEGHLTRRLFGAMLQRIWSLPVPTG